MAEFAHVLGHLGVDLLGEVDGGMAGTMPVTPDVCTAAGWPQLGVLATLADTVGGLGAAHVIDEGFVVTADLAVHALGPATTGQLTAQSRVLRSGSRAVISQVRIDDAAGHAVALAHMASTVLVTGSDPRTDRFRRPFSFTRLHPAADTTARAAYHDYLELRVATDDDGVTTCEVDLTPPRMTGNGFLHGGVVATLVDAAGGADGRTATDLLVRYLSAARVGPVRATATVAHGVAWVDAVDVGDGNRGVAAGTVRLRAT